MAIAYLSGTFASASSETSSVTSWAYDSGASGSDRVLVVFPVYENNTAADVTAITYNGVALTFQAVYVDDGGGFDETIEAWTLVNPATGSNTLAFTLSQTGRDLGFSAAVYTGVDQTAPVGNTAISPQYLDETNINADLVFAANSMGVYCSSQNRASSGPFTARAGNTQRGEYSVATGNSGFTACLGDRGPEASAGTYNCGSDATTASIGGGCVAIELLEAAGGGPATITGTGSHQATTATQTGIGERLLTGTASHSAQAATQTAIGTTSAEISGTGSHQAQAATHSAIGEREITGTATGQANTATQSAIAEREINGVSVHQASQATQSASGAVGGVISGSAAHQANTSTQSATGERVLTGSASHTAATAAQAASGSVGNVVSGAGSHAANDATQTAIGLRIVGGTATHQANTSTHTASGTSQGTISGTASHQATRSTQTATGLRLVSGSANHQASTATQAGSDIPLVEIPLGVRSISDLTPVRGILDTSPNYGILKLG